MNEPIRLTGLDKESVNAVAYGPAGDLWIGTMAVVFCIGRVPVLST